jgi:hypothetical protein
MTDKTFPRALLTPVVRYLGYPVSMVEADYLAITAANKTFSAGRPDSFVHDADPDTVTYGWDATFTPEQEAEWELVLKRAGRKVEPSNEAALTPHFAVLRSYWDAPSPTAAQTATALRAVIAVLREMWKE